MLGTILIIAAAFIIGALLGRSTNIGTKVLNHPNC